MEGHRGESRHRRHSRSRYDLQVLDSPYRSCSTPLPLLWSFSLLCSVTLYIKFVSMINENNKDHWPLLTENEKGRGKGTTLLACPMQSLPSPLRISFLLFRPHPLRFPLPQSSFLFFPFFFNYFFQIHFLFLKFSFHPLNLK